MWLGIDLGTSGVKAVIIDERGAVVDQGVAPLFVSRPQPLWSEQDPEEWWTATGAAVRALTPALRRRVRAIGLAGQMHGATLLGNDHEPLRPAILWNDGRSGEECAELEERFPHARTITGNLAMPGFTAPKLIWMRKREPALFGRVCKVLLPKDYLRLKMTGEFASDMSDSAGTLWLDVARRRWSEGLLAACDLGLDHMPALCEGPEVTGRLRPEVAAAWGMENTPVVAGGGDNAAGAVGVGVVRDGDAVLSLGTSGVIFVATKEFQSNPDKAVHAFCHCLPNMWHQMSVHLSAASCVGWVMRITGARDAEEVFARAELAGPGSGPELFLPYLSGERTPHNDPHARGAFLELDHDTDAGRLCEAVLEGVAFALADGADALREAGGTLSQISVIGGGARSSYWGRILAASLDAQLVYHQDGEVGPALGAARLARLSEDGEASDMVCAQPPVSRVIQPDPKLRGLLADKRERFLNAYGRVCAKGGMS